jgi:hypothetical protein
VFKLILTGNLWIVLQNFQWHYQAEVMKIVILAGENEVIEP